MNLINVSRVGLGIATMGVVVITFRESLLASGLIAIAAQVAATLLMLWARLSFGVRSFHATADPTVGGLVTKGPYRNLRHPIYAAVLYFLWAAVLSHPNVINGLLGVLMRIALVLLVMAFSILSISR